MRVIACCPSRCCRPTGLVRAAGSTLLRTFDCSRRTPDLPAESETQGNATPFQRQAASDVATTSQASSVGEQDTSPPFQNSDAVPARSLLTVRLKAPLDAVSGSRTVFEALLDE